MGGVSDRAAMPALVESSAGRSARAAERRSALSIWTCDLEGRAGSRVDAGQTRRSLLAGEPAPVGAGELHGEAALVRGGGFVRVPARLGAGRSSAAISENVEAIDLFWRRARGTGRRGTSPVTRCPQPPQGGHSAVGS